jgi:hypothetical protein
MVSRGNEQIESGSLQSISRHLAGLVVANELIRDLLAILEARQASALDSRDVDENVLCAVFRFDEAKALGGVEPFYCSVSHNDFLSLANIIISPGNMPDVFCREFEGKIVTGVTFSPKLKSSNKYRLPVSIYSECESQGLSKIRAFCNFTNLFFTVK